MNTKIASVQMNSIFGDSKANLDKMTAAIREAAANGAKLIILPEGIYQGYCFESYEELFPLAEEIPGGTLCTKLIELAKKLDVYIIAGLYEKEGINLYNSALFVGPEEGHIGTYRKMHMWSTEKPFCEASQTGFPVFNTKLGKIGIMICYDLWFPETCRILTMQGADLIVTPAGWVKDAHIQATELPMANILCLANSHCNGVYIAAAARVGEERGTHWVANSIVTDPAGRILARASEDKEEIIYAEVDLRSAKSQRRFSVRTDLITNRRRDFYDEMLGYDASAYIQ